MPDDSGETYGHESPIPPSQNDWESQELLIDLRAEVDQILNASGLVREGLSMHFEVRISTCGNIHLKVWELDPVEGIHRDKLAPLLHA
jgi:hypothetical protein